MRVARQLAAVPVLAILMMTWQSPSSPSAVGATTCRVRNITQDSSGRSLIRMVEKAVDGDHLSMRGTCRGTVIVSADIVIRGGGDAATITGRRRTRAVFVRRSATATIRGVIVERGVVSGFGHASLGGGVLNRGELTLIGTVLRRNSATGSGAAIANIGLLEAIDSRMRNNVADLQGGGILNFGDGVLTLTDSTVSGNDSSNGGGGVSNSGTANLIRTTISGNSSRFTGGGIHNEGALTLVDSIVTANALRRGSSGGGIYGDAHGSVVLEGTSKVTGNAPNDCVGTPAC